MTSAIRDTRLAALSACSAEATLAASSARLFSAAWAPMASDTVPRSAATTASDRRDMPNPEKRAKKFISDFISNHYPLRENLVAPARYLVCRDDGRLTLNYAQFAAPQQTNS